MSGWSLALPEAVAAQMWTHLFRGDGDEHGGVLLAGVVRGNRGARLVAREFVPAVDGIDYVPLIIAGVLIVLFSIEHIVALVQGKVVEPAWN